MFGRRADGKRVKNMGLIDRAMPYFMPTRIDAVQLYTQPINCAPIDEFILKERKESGIHYNYTEILMAACVRMLYERPKTNRFVSNCMIYQRNYISVSITIKKKLTDDGEEITLKMYFTGRESLQQVKEIFDKEVEKNLKAAEESHKTTRFVKVLAKMPNWLYKAVIGLLRFGDKHGMLPMSLLDVSPFHTSIYVADLRSIKLSKVYHHLYNFGTTTMFSTLGKLKYVPVANREGEVSVEKQLELGLTLDERVCDGLYYSNSVRLLQNYAENPELLKEPLPEPELSGKELKKKQKQDKKMAKKLEKIKQKENKKQEKIAKKKNS